MELSAAYVTSPQGIITSQALVKITIGNNPNTTEFILYMIYIQTKHVYNNIFYYYQN